MPVFASPFFSFFSRSSSELRVASSVLNASMLPPAASFATFANCCELTAILVTSALAFASWPALYVNRKKSTAARMIEATSTRTRSVFAPVRSLPPAEPAVTLIAYPFKNSAMRRLRRCLYEVGRAHEGVHAELPPHDIAQRIFFRHKARVAPVFLGARFGTLLLGEAALAEHFVDEQADTAAELAHEQNATGIGEHGALTFQ